MSEKKHTTIEKGTKFDGSLESDGPVIVGGTVKGRLSAPALTVTENGSVDGDVRVSKLKSSGQVSGKIDADSIELSGRVNDGTVIQARSLEVAMTPEATSLTFGNCELRVGKAKKDGQQKPEKDVAKQQKKGAPAL